MYVEVEHTPEDFLALGAWYALRGRGQRATVIALTAWGAAIGGIVAAPSGNLAAVVVAVLIGVTAGGAFALWSVRRAPLVAARHMGSRGALELPTVYEVSPEGIGDRNRAGRGFVAWWAIERIGRTKTYLFVFVSPITAFIVPARAFASEGDWIRFADYVEDQYQRALGSIPG